MTLRGFASLDLISPTPCRPCDADRDGISIGEAAGFALLEVEGKGLALMGYGTSSDGHHMSAPHPRALGAIAAMRAALGTGNLSPDDIDYINLHGTGTQFNDAVNQLNQTVAELQKAPPPPAAAHRAAGAGDSQERRERVVVGGWG